jgi:hypothetical protein
MWARWKLKYLDDPKKEWGPITKLTFYDDYSILVKSESGFKSSQVNTLGCLVTAIPVYTYVDFIFGKNMVFLGGPPNALAAGGPDEDWHMRLNVNIGYYF